MKVSLTWGSGENGWGQINLIVCKHINSIK